MIGRGRQDLCSLSGISLSTHFVFPLCFFISGLDPWSTFFRFLTYLFLTVTSAIFFYNRCLLLSCATFSIYHPLSRSVYICRSIARIRLFIITVQACYYLYTSLILSFCCRAVPPDRNSFVSSSVYIGYSICTCCLPNIATRSRHIVTLCRLGQITKHLEGRQFLHGSDRSHRPNTRAIDLACGYQ